MFIGISKATLTGAQNEGDVGIQTKKVKQSIKTIVLRCCLALRFRCGYCQEQASGLEDAKEKSKCIPRFWNLQ